MKAKSVNKFKALGMIDEVEESFLTAAKLDPKHIDSRWALVILYIELPGIIGGSEKKHKDMPMNFMHFPKLTAIWPKAILMSILNVIPKPKKLHQSS